MGKKGVFRRVVYGWTKATTLLHATDWGVIKGKSREIQQVTVRSS